MLLTLLPTTNIYLSLPIKDPPPLDDIQQQYSAQYYLNKIKEKTKSYNYTPFINAFVNLSKQPTTNMYFVFIELIQHFDFLANSRQKIIFKSAKGGVDKGIIPAFYRVSKIENDEPIENATATTILTQEDTEFVINIVNSELPNSNLILIMDDCFDKNMVKLLYFVCAKYDKVFVTKPMACWAGSSTKYIICKSRTQSTQPIPPISLETINPTNIFLNRVEEMNCVFVEQQIEMLITIFNKKERSSVILKSYQQKCIGWFIKHQLEYKRVDMEYTPFSVIV